MQWSVLGPGAMGCLWAYYLYQQQVECIDAKSQHEPLHINTDTALAAHPKSTAVQMIGRQQDYTRLIDIHKSGINGTHKQRITLTSVKALKQSALPIQGILISTKAFDTCSAFASVMPYFTHNCPIIVLCNGIHAQQNLAKQFPHHRIYALVTAVGAYLTAPFHVTHAGQGENYIGPLTASAQAQPITDFPLSTQWDLQIQQRMG